VKCGSVTVGDASIEGRQPPLYLKAYVKNYVPTGVSS
jgi:hypothetical protein